MPNTRLPEILAPVGTKEMCLAAIHNGADAVYLGMPGFNARGRCETFELESMKELIDLCHLYGVKAFIACNVLVFEDELAQVTELLTEVIALAPDAFIVQDIGVVRLIKEIAPSQVVHASTQMTVTSAEAIFATQDLGLSRYVLGREVSFDEMRSIREMTDRELEVFVHGALCVSYSGQCLTSERIGGRSANRGQCAQSCRLEYDLIVDGERRALGSKRYLVSPQDLCALEDVNRLAELGIDSFKIEGRLKSPEYVASTVRSYRHALSGAKTSRTTTDELEIIYSRGFYNGWMDGVNHQKLVRADYSNHHGLEVGTVQKILHGCVQIASRVALAPGQGVLFTDLSGKTGSSRAGIGGQIYQALEGPRSSEWRIAFANDFPLSEIHPGMTVFLNSSPALVKELRRSFTERDYRRRIPIKAVLRGAMHSLLSLSLSDFEGRSVTVYSELPLVPAVRNPLQHAAAHSELRALSDTPFELSEFEWDVAEGGFIQQRALRKLRQLATEQLAALRIARPSVGAQEPGTLRLVSSIPPDDTSSNGYEINLLIREQEQIKALADLPLSTVYLDFEFGRDYSEAVTQVRALGYRVGIASTRIHKPGENGHLKQIARLRPDAVLVRNLGALYYLQDFGLSLYGDFSLNIANSLTAQWFFQKGLKTLCPSYDLNYRQLFALLERSKPGRFEVTVHQYMPSFHMEHCVFAAFLSDGTSYRDCGRPCEKHRVALRDPSGALQPLKADAECRNTMFSGTPQSAARLIPELQNRGLNRFRIEALYETPEELRRKLLTYASLITREISVEQAYRALGLV